jgi:DNA-binding GntR family transcriptional regulator
MGDFQRPPTAQEAVLAEVRRRILAGSLPAGAPLRQEELAAELGVSRLPLREALRVLESEGLVEHAPHRGHRVVALTLADLEETYHLRSLIEDDLARRATIAAGPEHVARMRAAHAELADLEASVDPDPAALAAANRRFHWAVLRPGPRADRVLSGLWDATEAYRARWFAEPGNVRRGADEHSRVVDAVAAGDAEAVVRILAAHRSGAVDALRRRIGE